MDGKYTFSSKNWKEFCRNVATSRNLIYYSEPKTSMRPRQGISPVVATVILVAIAIVIALAVAFWAGGLVGAFTRFEKIELSSVYAVPGTTAGTYDVTIVARNTGSSAATIDAVHINGVLAFEISGTTCTSAGTSPPGITSLGSCTIDDSALEPGETATIQITGLEPTSSGITIEVAVHTASGKLYPSSVLLP